MAKTPDGLVRGDDGVLRCSWGGSTPDYLAYHDDEWGRPVTRDTRLFEKICLEGFQSGLSWITILRKRPAFRRAFDGFDFRKVARYDARRVHALLQDAGIVRHRGKIESTIHNAGRAQELVEEFGSLSAFFWTFEPGPSARPRRLTREALLAMPKTAESTALSQELKRRGWTFVGPTTVYAFMQAMGLVNDHIEGCHARPLVEEARNALSRPRPRAATLRAR
jgi:DNA-3-methyladenine glycosylase I